MLNVMVSVAMTTASVSFGPAEGVTQTQRATKQHTNTNTSTDGGEKKTCLSSLFTGL